MADGISRIRYRSTAAVLLVGLTPNTEEATKEAKRRLCVPLERKGHWIPPETPESVRAELDDLEWHHSMYQDTFSKEEEQPQKPRRAPKDRKAREKPRQKSEAKTLQQITEDIKKEWDETQRKGSTQTRGAKGGTKVDITGTRAEGAQVTTS